MLQIAFKSIDIYFNKENGQLELSLISYTAILDQNKVSKFCVFIGFPLVHVYNNTVYSSEPSESPVLSIPAATDSSVTLTFAEPPCGTRNGEIISYTYFCHNGQEILQGIIPAALPTVTVHGISCDSQFVCSAAAITDTGLPGPYVDMPLHVDGSVASGRHHVRHRCNIMICPP